MISNTRKKEAYYCFHYTLNHYALKFFHYNFKIGTKVIFFLNNFLLFKNNFLKLTMSDNALLIILKNKESLHLLIF